jgi:hypothetical protein
LIVSRQERNSEDGRLSFAHPAGAGVSLVEHQAGQGSLENRPNWLPFIPALTLIQQFQLCVAEFFAGWTVLLNALQPQPFFQELNFQVGELQLAFQLDYHGGIGGIDDRGCGSQHG